MGNGPISRKQVTWNFCVGKSEGLREVIDQYHLSTGKTTPVSELGPQLVVFVSLASVLMELACYLFFFGHIYFHEEGLLSREVLTRGEVKRRRRINAITFVGQFYGFIVECIFYFGIIYTLHEKSEIIYRVSLVLCFWIEFGFVSVVEVVTSKNLQQLLPHNRFFQ